jgi:hypothetical protein
MALWFAQPLTEISSTRSFWGKARLASNADSRHLWADCLENVLSSIFHKPVGLYSLLQG